MVVAMCADGRIGISGSGDNTVRSWDMAAGQLLHTLDQHTKAVTQVALSADGRQARSGDAITIRSGTYSPGGVCRP
ncbi:hypothetical protein AWC27_00750 [Mycobacterium szulgai]|uniref:Uncharacterized protein n=1 Tax=Mycobacterium szulgai TaxID=1787 RepID=A0A1X2DTI2_MYCSZ|nr:hypothetical protein AWC27_00750 [Mycobacterium szulgai]